MSSVLFVCMGNICRSPTAEGIFRHTLDRHGLSDRVEVDSAGTHGYHIGHPPDQRAMQVALERGIDLSGLRARRVEATDFSRFEYILALDEHNLEALELLQPPQFSGHLGLLMDFAEAPLARSVPDPYYGGDTGFLRVFDMIEEASEGLIEAIRPGLRD